MKNSELPKFPKKDVSSIESFVAPEVAKVNRYHCKFRCINQAVVEPKRQRKTFLDLGICVLDDRGITRGNNDNMMTEGRCCWRGNNKILSDPMLRIKHEDGAKLVRNLREEALRLRERMWNYAVFLSQEEMEMLSDRFKEEINVEWQVIQALGRAMRYQGHARRSSEPTTRLSDSGGVARRMTGKTKRRRLLRRATK